MRGSRWESLLLGHISVVALTSERGSGMPKMGRGTSGVVGDLGLGAAIGYGAGRAMDRATGWYLGRQSEASRRREEEVAPGGAPVLAGKKLAGFVGRDVTDAEAARIGLFVHGSLGMAYGVVAAALVRAGTPPFRAGIMAGTAAFVVVDEGVNSALFTPPPRAYPLESHLRGVVGHLAYGVAAGVMLAVARGLGAMRPREPLLLHTRAGSPDPRRMAKPPMRNGATMGARRS